MLASPLAESLKGLDRFDLAYIDAAVKWQREARPTQLAPGLPGSANRMPDDGWTIWLANAGRGWGKTRVGAQWLLYKAFTMPGAIFHAIARTGGDLRLTMFEGPAGLCNVAPPSMVAGYNRSTGTMRFHNGSVINGFSAEEPNRLRGPQCHAAWCFPAGTLVTMGDGGAQEIESVIAGDSVMTRRGPRRVLAAAMTGSGAVLWRVTLAGGTIIEATPGHLFWVVGRGWVPLDHLSGDDELCLINAGRGGIGSSLCRPPSTLATCGIAESTTTLPTVGARRCTGVSTKTGMARSSRATSFITATKYARIIGRAILKRCFGAGIRATTARASREATDNALSRPKVSASDGKPGPSVSHSVALYAAKATKCAVLSAITAARFARAHARIAGDRTLLFLRNVAAKYAPASTRQLSPANFIAVSGATPALFANPGTAARALADVVALFSGSGGRTISSAGAPALSRVRVANVEKSPRRADVYDIAVEGEPEFFANGALVHNCDELAAWLYASEAWQQVIFSTRLRYTLPSGAVIQPQILATTTPKPISLIRELRTRPDVVVTLGTSYENRDNLGESFFDEIVKYEGTTIGRQEIHGELIDPEESGVIRRSWFRLWPHERKLPKFEHVIVSLDTAFTEETFDRKSGAADFTACTAWGVFEVPAAVKAGHRHGIMLLDCWRDKLGLPGLIDRARRDMNVGYGGDKPKIAPLVGAATVGGTGRKPDILLIEDKGSGVSLRQMLAREDIIAYPYNPGRASKLERLHAVSHVPNAGVVWLVESDDPKRREQPRKWSEDWIAEVCSYCGEGTTDHDDYVDSTSQAWRYLADLYFSGGFRKRDKVDDIPAPARKPNPYAQ